MKLTAQVKMNLIVKSREDYKRAILSLLERNRDAQILDLGCGDPSRLTNRVRESVGTHRPVHGIDLQRGLAESGIILSQGDLNLPFPFREGTFDIVVASQIIEHLWNTDGFVRETKRVLKPGGYTVVSTPNLAAWYNILYLLLGRQPEPCKVSEEMHPDHERPGHLRIFTLRELVRLLEFHGLQAEKVIKTFGNVTVKARRCQT